MGIARLLSTREAANGDTVTHVFVHETYGSRRPLGVFGPAGRQ